MSAQTFGKHQKAKELSEKMQSIANGQIVTAPGGRKREQCCRKKYRVLQGDSSTKQEDNISDRTSSVGCKRRRNKRRLTTRGTMSAQTFGKHQKAKEPLSSAPPSESTPHNPVLSPCVPKTSTQQQRYGSPLSVHPTEKFLPPISHFP